MSLLTLLRGGLHTVKPDTRALLPKLAENGHNYLRSCRDWWIKEDYPSVILRGVLTHAARIYEGRAA